MVARARRALVEETLEVKTVSTSGGAGDELGATHRGIFATRAIAGDGEEELIVVPRRATVIACGGDGSGEADAGGRDEEHSEDKAPRTRGDELAIELLRLRSAGSEKGEFAEYINSMPSTYNLLQSWSDEEIDALQDASGEKRSRSVGEQIRRAYTRNKKRLVDILGEKGCSFSEYEWAMATVSSRAVSVPFHAAGALCPMGDMFNYASGRMN